MDFSQEVIQTYLLSHRCSTEENRWNLHLHPNSWEILLFKSGNVDYYIDHHFFHLSPGDLLLIPPNLVHGYCSKDQTPYERIPVHISLEFACSLCTEQTNPLKCFSRETHRHLHLEEKQVVLFENYVDGALGYLQKNSFGSDIYIRAVVSLILLLVNSADQQISSSTSSAFPELIQKTLTYIDEHYTENLSVAVIAEQMGISSSRLCHIFKDFMGISLWNYVINRRIRKARQLLQQGLSITDACFECGFQDYSHFIKSFHKIVGVPPRKYIQGILPPP